MHYTYCNKIIFSALLGLVSASAFAMDSGKTPQWECSLGQIVDDHKQYFLLHGQRVGSIDYLTRASDNNCRYIANVTIFKEFRNKGIGSACMRLFIAKTKAEGFTRIQLFSLPKAYTFYDRLGFKPSVEDSSKDDFYNYMTLDLETIT